MIDKELRRRYEAGESIRQLAASEGGGYTEMRTRLRAAGTTMRPGGNRSQRTWTAQEETELIRLAMQGRPASWIARELRRSVSSIENKSGALGVVRPVRQRRRKRQEGA